MAEKSTPQTVDTQTRNTAAGLSMWWRLWQRHLRTWCWPPAKALNEGEDRLAWLVMLRWGVVASQLLFTSLATQLLFVPRTLAPWLMLSSLGVALANSWLCRRLYQGGISETRRQRELLYSLLLDLVQFLVLMALTQGIHNPFYPFVFVYVVLGAVLLPTALSWVFLGVLAAGLYLLNPVVYVFSTQLTYVRISSLVAWLIQLGVVTAVWAIAGAVSRRQMSYRQALSALQTQQQHLQKLHLLGTLGAGVAHEFASPLNTLRLRLERLNRQLGHQLVDPPEDLQVALRTLAQCEQRLHSLATLPTQQDLAKLEPVRVAPLVGQVLEKWRTQFPAVEVKLESQLPEQFSLQLPELLLKQALINLLDNAAQAMQGQGDIILQLKLHKQQFCLCLEDQGPGWPEVVLQHLGQPFVTTKASGTGLGLYSVFMLAQSLSGQLELSHPPTGGARIKLCLPLSP